MVNKVKLTLTTKEVRLLFKNHWAYCCEVDPRLTTDIAAKRYCFSTFVDGLHRDGKITDRVADRVTLED